MFEQFKSWYLHNYTQINWFIIGFLIASALASFSRGEWADATFCLVMAWANYCLSRD